MKIPRLAVGKTSIFIYNTEQVEKARKHLKKAQHKAKSIWSKKPIRIILIVLSVLLLLFAASELADRYLWKPAKDIKYGVTFIKNYAEELELDWQETMTALMDDMELKHFRLVSYWTNHEQTPGEYKFDDLDWQMDEVAKRGGTVDLAIGLRQPRWPECHEPEWAKPLPDDQWKEVLYEYITIVVERYKDHPALARYQLENEAVNNWFGECRPDSRHVDRERLVEEYEMVKNLDPDTPIAMSLSDQHGLPVRQPVPDAYGFSVYRVVYNRFFVDAYVTYPTPIWYHRLRAAIVQQTQDRPTFIHELQMEPWGPVATQFMSIEDQNRSMSVDQLSKNINFARRIGMQDIYLWGGEWWYWRKEKMNDPSIWERVREEIQYTNSSSN